MLVTKSSHEHPTSTVLKLLQKSIAAAPKYCQATEARTCLHVLVWYKAVIVTFFNRLGAFHFENTKSTKASTEKFLRLAALQCAWPRNENFRSTLSGSDRKTKIGL